MAGGDDAGDLDDLERWAADARAREAAEARVRERWLRTQAEESSRMGLVLAGLAERRADVVVTTRAGRAVTGRLTAVGRDFLAIDPPGRRMTLVALHAVAWLREAPGDRRRASPAVGPDEDLDAPDDEGLDPAASLAGVLAQAVGNRPRIAVQAEGASVSGELRTVGVDVLVIEIAGEPPALAYVRLRSVYEISFLDSG
jgi:hypothetical protein